MNHDPPGGISVQRSLAWLAVPRRIGLRFVLAAVFVVALALAWEANQAGVQRSSVAAISRAGGTVRYDWGLLAGLEGDHASLMGMLVRTLGIDHLATVTGADLRGATDALAPRIGALGSLDQLNLRGSPITDVGLESLASLTRLERLDLTHTRVTSRGMVHLKSMTHLKMLWLAGDSITSEGLEALKALPNLELLALIDTSVDDAGLEVLKGLKTLRDVNLARTKVTPLGLESLKLALPNTIIRP